VVPSPVPPLFEVEPVVLELGVVVLVVVVFVVVVVLLLVVLEEELVEDDEEVVVGVDEVELVDEEEDVVGGVGELAVVHVLAASCCTVVAPSFRAALSCASTELGRSAAALARPSPAFLATPQRPADTAEETLASWLASVLD
jgi:hypothetical protein